MYVSNTVQVKLCIILNIIRMIKQPFGKFSKNNRQTKKHNGFGPNNTLCCINVIYCMKYIDAYNNLYALIFVCLCHTVHVYTIYVAIATYVVCTNDNMTKAHTYVSM